MKRSICTITALITLGLSSSVFAAPPVQNSPNATSLDTASIENALKNIELPSQAELDEMLEKLPDFNILIDDVMVIMKDEKLRTNLKSSAQTLKNKIEDSDVLSQRDANGLPDLNELMSVMLSTITEDGMTGELLGDLTELAGEMEDLAEKHLPKSTSTNSTAPKPKP
ncbi:MAG: hypothetical protein ABJG88_13155 [Litorimonas sp.]